MGERPYSDPVAPTRVSRQRRSPCTVEGARLALGEAAFAAAWAAGRALMLEEAIRYALEEVADG